MSRFDSLFSQLDSGESRFSGLFDQLDAMGEWEDATPIVQRRRKPGGGWEYRPKQIAGAAPGLGKAEDPYADTSPLSVTTRQVIPRIKANLISQIEAPSLARAATLPLGPLLGPPAARALDRALPEALRSRTPAPLEELHRGSQEDVERAKEDLRQSMAVRGAPPLATAATEMGFGAEAIALDPLNLIGASAGSRARGAAGALETAGQRTLRKAIGREAAEAIAPPAASGRQVGADLEELARLSLDIGESPAAARVPVKVIDAGGEGAVRRLAAVDDAGNPVGSMTYTREPGGGFRVVDVETGQRGTGAGRAMYRAAAEREGPYRGSMAQTPEGEGFVGRLRETDPDIFAEPRVSEAGSVGTGPLSSLRDWITENVTGGGPSAGKYKLAARELGGKATPEGSFALSIPKRIEAMQERKAVPVGRAQDLIDEVGPLVKRAAPSKAGQKALWQNMQKAVEGKVPIEEIPEPLRPFIARRQDLVEALQKRGIETGAFPDDMVQAIAKSGGGYSHRTYRAFKDPKHFDRTVNTPDWYALKTFLQKEMPGAPETEVLGYMKQIVKREHGTKALEIAHAPTRLNSILRERQNLPEPVRRAMGEETDFRAVLSDTVYQMAHDIEAHNFWTEVGDAGRAAGAFRTVEQGPTEMIFRRIPGSNTVDGVSSRGPVEGLFTSEALKETLVGQFEMVKSSKWNRFAAAVNVGKTVFSIPTGHIRNFTAHHVTSFVNGKDPTLVYRRARDIYAAYHNPVTLDRMRELGIAGQGASSQEIFDFTRMLEEEAINPLVRAWGRFGRKAGKYWGKGDDVWRAAHWMDETDQLAWANPGMGRPEVEAWAADRVKDTFQTYSRAPEYARKLRRTPFGGPGVTFHAESMRNVKNIAKVAAEDIATGIRTQNPRMVVLGLRRATGLMAAPVAVASIPAASRMMSGMDREAQEAARRQAEPYYHQNAEQLILEFKPGESFSYVDVSFLNPYSAISKTAIATQRAVTQGQPPVEALAEFLDQISGGDIATKELLQLALNRPIKTVWPLRTYDTQIGNFDEGAGRATGELAYHAYRGLAPGGVVQLENVARGAGALPQREEGRERTLGTELPAYAGFRVTTQKIPEALRRNLGAIGARVRDIRPKPPRNPAAVPERAADYLDSWEKLYGEVRTLVEDFDRMGVTPQKMREIAATTAAPQSMLRAAMRGDELAPSPITVSQWGQLPESWATPDRLPLARAILAEWRRRYAER